MTTYREALDQCVRALEFYADPFAWKKKHDPENDIGVPDFYSELSFGDTASEALAAARAVTEALRVRGQLDHEMSYPLEDCRFVTKEEMDALIADETTGPWSEPASIDPASPDIQDADYQILRTFNYQVRGIKKRKKP